MSDQMKLSIGSGLACRLERIEREGYADVLRCPVCLAEYYNYSGKEPDRCFQCDAVIEKR